MATVYEPKMDDDNSSVTLTAEALEALAEPYKYIVVIKVLDKHFSYTNITHRLRSIWRTKEGYE
ncbi:hypothetical protein PIB30_094950, partial [Stylosanthes scabra]|nr:hypothetical protein [Stylosanthes scabra]